METLMLPVCFQFCNVSQNVTHIILNIVYSCKTIAMTFSISDIAMALAIKCAHNLPTHLSYVSTLPDIIQKPKRDIDELKQRLTDTWDHIPQGIIDKTACMCKGKGTSL